jgi:hypothetical protein
VARTRRITAAPGMMHQLLIDRLGAPLGFQLSPAEGRGGMKPTRTFDAAARA